MIKFDKIHENLISNPPLKKTSENVDRRQENNHFQHLQTFSSSNFFLWKMIIFGNYHFLSFPIISKNNCTIHFLSNFNNFLHILFFLLSFFIKSYCSFTTFLIIFYQFLLFLFKFSCSFLSV